MIKIFRRIRHSLLSENKFSKYFVYAFGEILLVVIGILIALQINNWNTEQKEKKELHSYLKTIVNNLNSDNEQIKVMLAFRDSVRVYSGKIMRATSQDHIKTSDLLLVVHDKYNAFYDQFLETNPSGFEALKNSGYIGKLQGTQLEKLINDYYLLVNSISKQEKSLNDFIESMEVLGFEQHIFTALIKLFERSGPELEMYVANNQEEVISLLNHSSIVGANLRGTMSGGLIQRYKDLIALGDAIKSEVETITKKQ